jgi:hypothetical protein
MAGHRIRRLLPVCSPIADNGSVGQQNRERAESAARPFRLRSHSARRLLAFARV